jgi:hypothetical protein
MRVQVASWVPKRFFVRRFLTGSDDRPADLQRQNTNSKSLISSSTTIKAIVCHGRGGARRELKMRARLEAPDVERERESPRDGQSDAPSDVNTHYRPTGSEFSDPGLVPLFCSSPRAHRRTHTRTS